MKWATALPSRLSPTTWALAIVVVCDPALTGRALCCRRLRRLMLEGLHAGRHCFLLLSFFAEASAESPLAVSCLAFSAPDLSLSSMGCMTAT